MRTTFPRSGVTQKDYRREAPRSYGAAGYGAADYGAADYGAAG